MYCLGFRGDMGVFSFVCCEVEMVREMVICGAWLMRCFPLAIKRLSFFDQQLKILYFVA